MYLRSQPTEGGMRIQSYTHSLTEKFMGDWAPATPTGLNTSLDYQPDGLVVWPYEGALYAASTHLYAANTPTPPPPHTHTHTRAREHTI